MFLFPPCSVHLDRRPDLKSKRRLFTSFCFPFFKSLLFCSCLCLSRGKEVATRPSALARVKSAWEFCGIAASPLPASPHARRSREISAAGCGYSKPAGWLPSSRVAAHPARRSREIDAAVRGSPSPPFAGDHAAVRSSPNPPFAGDRRHHPQLTQARRSREITPPARR